MKHYKLPKDVDFPEIDPVDKAAMDAAHEELERIHAGIPKGRPKVISFTPELLRKLPPKNRAMYKYVWLRHVREYEDYMRQHPELDQD